MVQRDIASIVCYGLLFASVVVWAELRPANPNLAEAADSTRAAMSAKQIVLSDDQPELRRLVKHMRIP